MNPPVLAFGLGLFRLGVIFDAAQLTAPIPGERAGPFVHWSQCVGIGAVERAASVAAHVDEADVQQNLQMLRYRRLRETERDRDVANRALLGPEILEDFAAPRFGDGIEGVRSGRSARHTAIIFP